MSRSNKQQALLFSDVANVLETFSLDTVRDCEHLRVWQTVTGELAAYQQQWLEEVRNDLVNLWDLWNEEELKMNFISSVFRAAQIDEPKRIATFYERPMRGRVQDQEISVICDCMVATPTKGNRPDKPYFFFQEFKRSKGDKFDPEAQMLVAMLLAQAQNDLPQPIYGAWLQGKFWHFTTLSGSEYCIGRAYDATDPEDLRMIILILRRLKELILQRAPAA